MRLAIICTLLGLARVGLAGDSAQWGELWILAAGVEKKVLGHVELDGSISGTVTAANGVLYLASNSRLYAVGGR